MSDNPILKMTYSTLSEMLNRTQNDALIDDGCVYSLNYNIDEEIKGNLERGEIQTIKNGKWLDVQETVISGKTNDGKEIEVNIVSGKCSRCQYYAEQVNVLPPIMRYSICPHCGANMGG